MSVHADNRCLCKLSLKGRVLHAVSPPLSPGRHSLAFQDAEGEIYLMQLGILSNKNKETDLLPLVVIETNTTGRQPRLCYTSSSTTIRLSPFSVSSSSTCSLFFVSFMLLLLLLLLLLVLLLLLLLFLSLLLLFCCCCFFCCFSAAAVAAAVTDAVAAAAVAATAVAAIAVDAATVSCGLVVYRAVFFCLLSCLTFWALY